MTQTAKPLPRTRKAEQRAETMELILDTAELLFSQHGLHGVTLKEVAKRVGVHHTLLNYYFTDKKALFDAVFSRRAAVTVERRMKALDDYEIACGGKPTVEGALTRSSIPISISISTVTRVGKTMLGSQPRLPTRHNGAPS